MTRSREGLLFAVLSCLLIPTFSAAQAPQFSIVNIGSLGGATGPRAMDQLSPVVVGWSTTTGGDQHAFFWEKSKGIQDLETLLGTTGTVESIAEDVHCNLLADCLIVGSRLRAGKRRGFLIQYDYKQGTIKEYDVRPLAGDTQSEAVAFNSNDVVVNSWGGPGGKDRTYLEWWANIERGTTAPSLVPNLPGGSYVKGWKIFKRSAVGFAEVKPGEAHAFIFELGAPTPGGKMSDIDRLGTGSAATGINAHDQISGYFEKANGEPVAALWELWTGRTALVDPFKIPISRANAVNTYAHVVGLGISRNGTASGAAYWTSNTGWVFLQNLIPAGSSWTLNDAIDINEAGQITGQGYQQPGGTVQGFFLEVTQKPSWYPCTTRTLLKPCP